MSRPAKNINLANNNSSKEEKEKRQKIETTIMGTKEKLKPQPYLNDRQREIFEFIFGELEDKGILGNLDNFVINQASVVIEKLEQISKEINNLTIEEICSLKIRNLQEQYFKQFVKYCNELCLSPQARAKIAIPLSPKEEASLIDLLGDDD